MILYDCHVTLEGEFWKCRPIASRVYDILLMKMGPDYICETALTHIIIIIFPLIHTQTLGFLLLSGMSAPLRN